MRVPWIQVGAAVPDTGDTGVGAEYVDGGVLGVEGVVPKGAVA